MSEDFSFQLSDFERRMQGSLNALKDELTGLRAGRANPALIESVSVPAYGSDMPLNQLASVSALDARTLAVSVWDASLAGGVGRAIEQADLGLNPIVEGTAIRVPLPELTRERRQELCKSVLRSAEGARVAIRNVRRDGMNKIKRAEKDKAISEDEHNRHSKQLQTLTDKYVAQVDDMASQKERDIMAV